MIRKNEIADIPTAGDPFGVVEQSPGIISTINIIDSGYAPTSLNMSFSHAIRGISTYGGDIDFNSYYFGHIQIPMNRHAATGAPIIPEGILYSMEIQKGIGSLRTGAKVGGMFRAIPDTGFEASEVLFNPGTDAFSLIWRWKISDRSGLILSATKSLSEIYTPLVTWVFGKALQALEFSFIESDLMLIPSTGDVCISAYTELPNRLITGSFIGYYDVEMMRIDMLRDYDGKATTIPFFLGIGGGWSEYHTASISQNIKAAASFYRKHGDTLLDMDIQSYAEGVADELGVTFAEMEEAFETIGTSGYIYSAERQRISVLSAEVSDTIELSLAGNAGLEAGVSLRFANIYGEYEGHTDFNLIYFDLPITQSHVIPEVSYSEDVMKLYGHGSFSSEVGGVQWSSGVGVTWYPLHQFAAPSLIIEAAIPDGRLLGKPVDTSARVGWSVVSYEEYVFAERRLSELFLETETASSYANLPRGVVFTGSIGTDLSRSTRIVVDPYVSWYYSLSGLALYAAYLDPFSGGVENRDLISQTEIVDPDYGYSAGNGVSVVHEISERLRFRGAYMLSITKYHARDGYWFYSNNDIRHTLDVMLSYNTPSGKSFSVDLDVYVDKPFTPEVVVDAETKTLEKGGFNSARDLIPRFAVGFRYEVPTKRFNRNGYLQVNCKNIFSFFNPQLIGMKQSSHSIQDASTYSFENREYSFFRTNILELASTIGFSIDAKYSF